MSRVTTSSEAAVFGPVDSTWRSAALGYYLLIAAFWAICDEMREETGAENLPLFPLVKIRNRR